MRLREITTREEANEFLTEYLPQYNRRFRVTPANPTDVHVKPERGFNLERYLCLKTDRTVLSCVDTTWIALLTNRR
jgi:hypothetical protein